MTFQVPIFGLLPCFPTSAFQTFPHLRHISKSRLELHNNSNKYTPTKHSKYDIIIVIQLNLGQTFSIIVKFNLLLWQTILILNIHQTNKLTMISLIFNSQHTKINKNNFSPFKLLLSFPLYTNHTMAEKYPFLIFLNYREGGLCVKLTINKYM